MKLRNKARLLSKDALSFSFPHAWPAQGVVAFPAGASFALANHKEKIDGFAQEPPFVVINAHLPNTAKSSTGFTPQFISVFQTTQDAELGLKAIQKAVRQGTHAWARRAAMMITILISAILIGQGLTILRNLLIAMNPATYRQVAAAKAAMNGGLDPRLAQMQRPIAQNIPTPLPSQQPAVQNAPAPSDGDAMLQSLSGGK